MPTGIALREARQLLFDAAQQVLRRDGASALTSRAVTAEAGVAKGVMHRHFTDFDAFLTELVLDRVARLDTQAGALHDAAGTDTVAGNLTGSLMALLDPVAVAIVGLVISRDGLRARLRQAGAARLPIISEGTAMIASYLTAERGLGRIAADADIDTLAPTLMGAAHLRFTDWARTPPDAAVIHKVVTTVMAGVTSYPLPHREVSSTSSAHTG